MSVSFTNNCCAYSIYENEVYQFPQLQSVDGFGYVIGLPPVNTSITNYSIVDNSQPTQYYPNGNYTNGFYLNKNTTTIPFSTCVVFEITSGNINQFTPNIILTSSGGPGGCTQNQGYGGGGCGSFVYNMDFSATVENPTSTTIYLYLFFYLYNNLQVNDSTNSLNDIVNSSSVYYYCSDTSSFLTEPINNQLLISCPSTVSVNTLIGGTGSESYGAGGFQNLENLSNIIFSYEGYNFTVITTSLNTSCVGGTLSGYNDNISTPPPIPPSTANGSGGILITNCIFNDTISASGGSGGFGVIDTTDDKNNPPSNFTFYGGICNTNLTLGGGNGGNYSEDTSSVITGEAATYYCSGSGGGYGGSINGPYGAGGEASPAIVIISQSTN
jgi:hypothetical protein